MNAVQTVTAEGFRFYKGCWCGGGYKTYRNAAYNDVEVKINKQNQYIKIFQGSNQVAVTLASDFKQTLINVGIA